MSVFKEEEIICFREVTVEIIKDVLEGRDCRQKIQLALSIPGFCFCGFNELRIENIRKKKFQKVPRS